MPNRATIGLDNPAFRGRLRQPDRMQPFATNNTNRHLSSRPAAQHVSGRQPISSAQPGLARPRLLIAPARPAAPTVHIVEPQPFVKPALPRQRPSRVLKRRTVRFLGRQNQESGKSPHKITKLQFTLIGMAAIVFIFGIASSLQTVKTNHNATAQIAALSRKTNVAAAGAAAVPSTTKPTASALSNYVVAPNLPRYIKIPKLGVDARVTQVGVTATGALGTPSNVFDAAWYTGSAEPGQPGATLIDGHVSSWTTQGVFYGLKTLVPGDSIQVVRGDGTIFNYQVVKTQVYGAGNVDMQAAMTPITAGKSGLNLITCTGDVIKGTSQFNQRIIVFAEQV